MTNPDSHRLWGGRFAEGNASEMDSLNRSITTDFRLWPFDIKLSRAWAAALETAGVLTPDETLVIRSGLDRVGQRLAAGEDPLPSDEDIHTMIDRLLHDEIGAPASKLHTGRSRNDQVATATRLWTIDACDRVIASVAALQNSLIVQAEGAGDAMMPAYTHLQRAQPVLLAHWLLAHFWPLHRDRARLRAAAGGASSLPLGSGAVAGSAFAVSRTALQAELGFASISQNSIDAVSDRDFVAESIFALTLLATHLSRLSEDLIIYGTSEFGFVVFGDRFSTGSSMMPQKRNPDALELARGSAARALGNLVAMLATLKGLPSSYNKDLQEDKRLLFETVDMLLLVIPAVTGALAEIRFDRGRMETALSAGLMATDLADYLVKRGVSFREAHAAVGQLVRESEESGVALDNLATGSFASAHTAFEEDAREWLSARRSVNRREVDGGTGPLAVGRQLLAARTARSS